MAVPIVSAVAGYPGSNGTPYQIKQSHTLAASGTLVLDAGWHFIVMDANDKVEITNDGTAANNTTILAASASGFVYADGTNVQIVNTGTIGTITTDFLLFGP